MVIQIRQFYYQIGWAVVLVKADSTQISNISGRKISLADPGDLEQIEPNILRRLFQRLCSFFTIITSV